MRLPNRKPGKYTFPKFDPHMTKEKYDQLVQKLDHIKRVSLPRAIAETKLHGENGDYSENAEYQIAKGRLRGLNRAVTELTHQIDRAIIIEASADTSTVQIGHTVTVEVNGNSMTWKILGSEESDPANGIISYKSPVGAMLLGRSVGQEVLLQRGDKEIAYTITSIA